MKIDRVQSFSMLHIAHCQHCREREQGFNQLSSNPSPQPCRALKLWEDILVSQRTVSIIENFKIPHEINSKQISRELTHHWVPLQHDGVALMCGSYKTSAGIVMCFQPIIKNNLQKKFISMWLQFSNSSLACHIAKGVVNKV